EECAPTLAPWRRCGARLPCGRTYRDARPASPRRRLACRTASARSGAAGSDSAHLGLSREWPDPRFGTGPPSALAPYSLPPGLPGTAATARCTALSSSYSPATALGILARGGARVPRAAGRSRQTVGESSLPP